MAVGFVKPVPHGVWRPSTAEEGTEKWLLVADLVPELSSTHCKRPQNIPGKPGLDPKYKEGDSQPTKGSNMGRSVYKI